jgi:threonine/homoserine/homoserine lactone efflux protein
VSFGFASIVALCTTGVGALILASPMLATVIHVVGVLYLLWLAYRIARSTSLAEKTVLKPMNVWQSAALQYANIKAWMLALAVAASYMAGAPRRGSAWCWSARYSRCSASSAMAPMACLARRCGAG